MDQQILQKTIALGRLILQFGRTNRATCHEDGETPESDTDHTVMLGIIACAFAARFAPQLHLGKVAQFALIHDLVEVYAGDTATLKHMSNEDQREKTNKEHVALQLIQKEFGDTFPWIHETIEEYERLDTPEARFVKTMDKSMPGITHSLNEGAAARKFGHSAQALKAIRDTQREKMKATYASDQKEALGLWELFVAHETKREAKN